LNRWQERTQKTAIEVVSRVGAGQRGSAARVEFFDRLLIKKRISDLSLIGCASHGYPKASNEYQPAN
jgi:hypothetical protein